MLSDSASRALLAAIEQGRANVARLVIYRILIPYGSLIDLNGIV
jgi:hypothetical protein